ncbi:polyamine-modulated factor 1-binding protein 1 [Candoia aspera]|uniref:polyamine-modulated factor 1-binding protein 1 n=1 Tax=Candoia aspera TaxID=51853 RepID=UPI002FD7D907
MEIENAHPVGEEPAEPCGNSVEGQAVWSGFCGTWWQSLPEQLQGSQVAVEQPHNQVWPQQKKPKRDGLSQTQSLESMMERQHLAPERLLQECQALKAQVSFGTPLSLPSIQVVAAFSASAYLQLWQYKAVTWEQERERSLRVEHDQHMREQFCQAERYVCVLESSLDLYKKKYQAALGRVAKLESRVQHLEEEAGRKAAGCAEKQSLPEGPQGKTQAEDSLGQLEGEQHRAWEVGQGWQLTCQQDRTIQELQVQLAASHTKLLQQKDALASLCREFASYKLTHGCSNTRHRNQLFSWEMLRQKPQQREEVGLWWQAEKYRALVQDLKLELARETEQSSSTLKELARLELAAQGLCREAAAERNWQQQELAALQHQVRRAQALLGQSHRLCAQKERAIQKRDRLLRRAWASHSIFQEQAQAQAHPLNTISQEARQGRAACAFWCVGAPVLQQRGPKSPEQQRQAVQALGQEDAAVKMAQEQQVECDLELQHPGRVGCPLEALHRRGCRAEAELAQKGVLGGGGPAAAAGASARELLKEPVQELSRSTWQPVQAASMPELEMLQRQQIESLQVSLEASRAGHCWLHRESELVVAHVRQWVKEQKQVNEELGHKLRTQVKQIAQLTGERDLLHELVERLQQDNQRLKNEADEKRIVCERIKALHNSDLEPRAVLQQLWHILLW